MSSKIEPRIEAVETELQATRDKEKASQQLVDGRGDDTYRRPHIGAVLKELRGPISLRELHRQTGIAVAHLSQIESGARKPRVNVLRRLAEFHEVDVTDLLELAGHLNTEPAGLEENETANIERAYRYVLDDMSSSKLGLFELVVPLLDPEEEKRRAEIRAEDRERAREASITTSVSLIG